MRTLLVPLDPGGCREAATIDRDTATGLLVAFVLVGAMAGVFLYERAQFHTYDVAWEAREHTMLTDAGTLDEGASNTHTFQATANRIASVEVEVTWEDDVGDPDTLEVSIDGPGDALQGDASGASSPLTVTIPVHDEPNTTTVAGRSPENARTQLNDTAAWTTGQGEWTVTVTLVSAPGETVAGQETEADGTQDYDVTLTVHRWTPTLQPRS